MKKIIYIFAIILCSLTLQSAKSYNGTATEEVPASASAAESFEGFPAMPADELALSPWEMLGEDDGLGDNFNTLTSLQSDLVDYASRFLGTRYRSGAKGPNAFDCSGFTSYVFRNFGMALSPSSRAQGVQGRPVSKDEVMVGDLMFFSGRRGGKTIGHVGMVIDVDELTGKIKFIHAAVSTGVEIQSFPDGGYYSQRFIGFRRVIDGNPSMLLREVAHDTGSADSDASML